MTSVDDVSALVVVSNRPDILQREHDEGSGDNGGKQHASVSRAWSFFGPCSLEASFDYFHTSETLCVYFLKGA